MRQYLFFLVCICHLLGSAQTISLSQQAYALRDTIKVEIAGKKDVKQTLIIDLVSPFGEVIAQRHTANDHVSFLIYPTWECGFYELRVYESISSPILTSYVIPILESEKTDSIPIWNVQPKKEITYPNWYQEFANSPKGTVKGLMVTSKGKPYRKAGIQVHVMGYDTQHALSWEGETITGTHGEFSIDIPRDKVFYIDITLSSANKKKLSCDYIILPSSKTGALSTHYNKEVNDIIDRNSYVAYEREDTTRNYYFYDMRQEALQSYFSNQRIPLVADWFVKIPYFAQQMRKHKRAVGWNGKYFSLWPKKRVFLSYEYGTRVFREHRLHAIPEGYNEFGQSYHVNHTLIIENMSVSYEGAPTVRISKISWLLVMTGHQNDTFLSDERSYMKDYDPMMVFFR